MKKLSAFPLSTSSVNFAKPINVILDKDGIAIASIEPKITKYRIRTILRMANFGFKVLKTYSKVSKERFDGMISREIEAMK